MPLDPEYPQARLEYMLADAQPAVVLTTERLRRQLPQSDRNRVAQSGCGGDASGTEPGCRTAILDEELLPRGCGVCDLYVGINGRAQGSGGDAGECDASVCGDGEVVQLRRGGCVDAVSFVCV